MMVIKRLSSSVDLDRAQSEHLMVVGLLETEGEGEIEVPIDAVTYGYLVGAFEQLQVQAADSRARQLYTESPSVPTVETVRQQVEQHLGHHLAPGPVPAEEVGAEAQLRALEQASSGAGPSDSAALLRSVGFIQDEDVDELAGSILAVTGTEDDEPDRGEGTLREDDDDDDGVAAF